MPALRAPRPPQVYFEVPRFSLIDQDRRRITREELLGKIWIANFMFTSCRTTCPQQTATMARLQADLQGEPDIRFVSITVDPDHDTPEVLARYAVRFDADSRRWHFLTGEEKAIYTLAQEGFRLSAGRRQPPVVHPSTEPLDRQHSHAERGPKTGGSTVASDDSQDGLLHDARFALVDRRARIRGYYSSLDADAISRLRRDVDTLLKAADEE
jgi:protein SCO1/2